MAYLLDSNTCIEILRQRFPAVYQRFAKLPSGSVFLSVISHGELLLGPAKGLVRARLALPLGDLLTVVPVLPLDEDVSLHYARIRAHLELRGEVIGANDLWIAAHAVSRNLTLVSENLREFRRVPGLKIENWVQRKA